MITDKFSVGRLMEIRTLIGLVTFPGYTFHLISKGCVLTVTASFMAPCNVDGGEPKEQFTRQWVIEPTNTNEQIVQTCLKLVLTSVEHEAREQFKFNGVAVFGPHLRLSALSNAAFLSSLGAQA